MSAINTLGQGLYGVGWLVTIGGGLTCAVGYFNGAHALTALGMGAAGVGLAMVFLGKLLK